jgi:hypothetical protein
MPFEARRCACQSKLGDVGADRWAPYEPLSESWCTHLSLTRRRAIARTMLHTVLLDWEASYHPESGMHRNSDKNLACGDGMNLDYDEVMASTGDSDIAIITLGSYYSMLSCQPAPPDALSTLCGRCADSWGLGISPGPHPIEAWASWCSGPKLLVGLKHTGACHAVSPDPNTG